MASVGERIRHERESRNMTLDDMAVATGIGQSYLASLERGEYHELPGLAFGKLYIRAYAEVLGFDPQPWIEDYDREHRLLRGVSTESTSPAPPGSRPMASAIARWRESKMVAGTPETDSEPEPVRESEPIEPIATPEPAREPEPMADPVPQPLQAARIAVRRIVVPFLVVIALALVVGFVLRGLGRSERAAPAATAPRPIVAAPVTVAPVTPPLTPPPPVVLAPEKPAPPKPAPPKPATPPAVKTSTPSADLAVTEFGVGRRIVNLKLEGESDHFAEGDRVSFSSRVVGGRRGNVIRHVWIYEGRAQQTITLRLGGADYRTHTNKTLGHAGAWAVEARDDKGRVLARADFTCEPRSR